MTGASRARAPTLRGVRLATADQCRALLRPVAAAMFEGEEVEELLAASVGADAEPPASSGSALSSLGELKARADRHRLVASRSANADRARELVVSFAGRLDALPGALHIESVGERVVVAEATRRAAPLWASQLGGDDGAVYTGVRLALADLRGAVMRLELGISRLG